MSGDAGHVTLIFYKLGERWWKEPFLNIVAAAAQMSSFTHVEVAIGSDAGTSGEMANVARVFVSTPLSHLFHSFLARLTRRRARLFAER